jgi:hypothetical protein
MRYLLLAFLALPATSAFADDGPPGTCECSVPQHPTSHWYSDRIGVGIHVTSMGLSREDAAEDEEPVGYGGGGLQLTYRLAPRWSLEAGTNRLESEETGATLDTVSFGARLHLTPYRRWDFYGLAAIGGATDQDEQHLGTFELGAGVERRFRRIGLSAELRMMGLQPHEEEANSAARMTSASAPGYSAGQLRLAASYHF